MNYFLTRTIVPFDILLSDLELSGETSLRLTGHEVKRAKGPKQADNNKPQRTLRLGRPQLDIGVARGASLLGQLHKTLPVLPNQLQAPWRDLKIMW